MKGRPSNQLVDCTFIGPDCHPSQDVMSGSFLGLGSGPLEIAIKGLCIPPETNSLDNSGHDACHNLQFVGFISLPWGSRLTQVHYVGEVGLGSPAQKFNVLFDTATPALWIPFDKFRSTESSSFQNLSDCQVSRPYTTGHFNALNKKDVLEIGGASVKDQSFELVTAGFEDKIFDGIFGLAYPSPSPVCGPEVIPVQNMANQGIAPAVFSFRYETDPYTKTPEHIGDVIFGIDNEYVDEAALKYITLSKKANWQIAVDRVNTLNGLAVCKEGCQAIIDSASPVIAGPIEEVNQLYQHITGGCSYHNGTYEINCQNVEHLPSLIFTINGIDYDLDGEDYVLRFPTRFGTTCISTLVGMDLPEKTWVLGDAFMKRFYTVFDQENGRVAFGQMKNDYWH
ncbi:unnamed protein product [Nezara viridula]|uniref:Peptidase A1 domain-containing protein n=1 Tax=Nezara viridula TaxID=85310 RepID=A0A9P0HGP3_NEZVI|nr:unnamed protein product [Nezara viridula]